MATVSTQPKMDADIYLADFVKTNLVIKFAVIWVKNGQMEERRRKEKNNGYNLGFYNGYFDGRGLFVGNIFKYKAFLSPEALK